MVGSSGFVGLAYECVGGWRSLRSFKLFFCLFTEKEVLMEAKNMKNEVLGWRFDDFSGLVFSCGFGFDEFFMFWRFRWRIGILYEILHCSGFDCALVLGFIVLGFGKNTKNKFLCSYLKNNESNNNNNNKIIFKSLFFFFLNLV